MKTLFPLTLIVLFFIIGKSYPVYLFCPLSNNVLYMFCHGNILHLFINIYSFTVLYKALQILGKWEKLGLLLFTGFVAGFFATMPTVGCSGGIFGMFGFYTAWMVMHGRNMWKQIGFTAVSIGLTFILPHLSGSVHLAGYLCGILIAIIYVRLQHRGSETLATSI